jgi:hypothetical protein
MIGEKSTLRVERIDLLLTRTNVSARYAHPLGEAIARGDRLQDQIAEDLRLRGNGQQSPHDSKALTYDLAKTIVDIVVMRLTGTGSPRMIFGKSE